MDGSERDGSNVTRLQPYVAEDLWGCDEPELLADVAELQPGKPELLAIEPGGSRPELLAHESTHEPYEPGWPIRRSDKSAVLAGIAQVLSHEPELQPCQPSVHADVTSVLTHVASDGRTTWWHGQGLLADFASILAYVATVFARVACVLAGITAVLASLATVFAEQPCLWRWCSEPWSGWWSSVTAPKPHVEQASLAALTDALMLRGYGWNLCPSLFLFFLEGKMKQQQQQHMCII